MGGITDIYCDMEYPIVASCCLDRHFRIHDLKEKTLIHEVYLIITRARNEFFCSKHTLQINILVRKRQLLFYLCRKMLYF